MGIEIPLCTLCRHYQFVRPGSTPTCDAFPDGIPDDIYENRVEHDQPISGDHGLRFIEMTDKELDAKLYEATAERERRARQEGKDVR